jgi:hypothetical protein
VLDRRWHFELGEYWDYSGDIAGWRWRLQHPWPPDPIAELFEVLRGGEVPLIGIPVQPNILWSKERQDEFLAKERVGRGPMWNGQPMPIRIPPEYLAEVGLRVTAEKWGGTELWWNCGLLAWRFVHFARDELIQAYMAYFELPPGAPADTPDSTLPPQSSAAPADTATMKPLLPEKKLKNFLRHRPWVSAKQDHTDAQNEFPQNSVPRDRLVVPVRKDLNRHGKRGRPAGKAPGGKDL